MKKKAAGQKLVLYLPDALPALAIVAFVALLFSASVAYVLLTPAYVEVSSESGSIVGDGATGTVIFAEVRNTLGLPVPFASVQFSADRGSLDSEKCTAGIGGSCGVYFIPVKSLSAQTATITASSGSASDYTAVTMSGDIAKRLDIGLEYLSLPANGYSTSTITVIAYDWIGNQAPDGTEVTASASPADSGTFSDDGMCYTVNGRCSITFTSSVNPGNATVSAASGDARTSAAISLLAIPPESIALSLSAASIPADGQATVLATVSVADELGNPVPSQQVSASSSLGTLDKHSCQTDSSGNCGFTYTAGTVPGTETVTVSLEGYNLSASRQLILMPVSDLGVSMMAYENVGNPIIPAFARSVAFHGHDMVRLIIENDGNSRFEGTVSVEVSGWSERSTESIGIDAGDTADITFSPPLKDAAYENLDSVPVNYLVVVPCQ